MRRGWKSNSLPLYHHSWLESACADMAIKCCVCEREAGDSPQTGEGVWSVISRSDPQPWSHQQESDSGTERGGAMKQTPLPGAERRARVDLARFNSTACPDGSPWTVGGSVVHETPIIIIHSYMLIWTHTHNLLTAPDIYNVSKISTYEKVTLSVKYFTLN